MRGTRSSGKAPRKGGHWVVSWLNAAPSTADELQKWACKMTHSEPPEVTARDVVEAHELRRLITWASFAKGEEHLRHRRAIAIWSRRRARQIGSLLDLHTQVAKDYLSILAGEGHLFRCLGCGKWFVGGSKPEQQCQVCRNRDRDAEPGGDEPEDGCPSADGLSDS